MNWTFHNDDQGNLVLSTPALMVFIFACSVIGSLLVDAVGWLL